MLSASNVTKCYGQATALEKVSFELEPGRVLAIIGANGAGKTTLIKCIAGLARFEGTITVGGFDVARRGKDARRLIGYLPQSSALPPDMTVQEATVFFAQLKGVDEARAREAVRSAGLKEHADKQVAALSGGMNQRLALAIALLASPPLLVLDEPVAGLDVAARLHLRQLIDEQRRAGTAIILSTHWIEDVPYIADDALVVENGRPVYYGPAARLIAGQAATSRLFLRLNGSTTDAVQLIRAMTPAHGVDRASDWLVVTCPAGEKAHVIETLLEAGITILDFRVEEAPVSEAVRHLDGAQGIVR